MSTLALPRGGHDPRDVHGTLAMQQLIDWNNHAIGVWMQGQAEDAERLLWTAMTNLEEQQQGVMAPAPPQVHPKAKELEEEDEEVLVLMMTTEDEHLDVPSEEDLQAEEMAMMDSDDACVNEEFRSIAAVDLSSYHQQGTPTSTRNDSDDDDCLPLYHRALVLAPTATVQEVTAVLGYNAALYHHSQAVSLMRQSSTTACSSSSCTAARPPSQWQLQLQTGLQYYDGVWQLLQQHGWIDELLVMALFYNMGHAHWQLQQKEQALFCMDFLQQVLKDSPAHLMVRQALQDNDDDSSTASSCVDDHAFFVVHALQQFPGEHMNLAPAA